MDRVVTYLRGKPATKINLDSVIDSIADQVLADGDIEKALQRAFRFGTEDDLGLLDILDRLREEIHEDAATDPDLNQHEMEAGVPASERRVEDAVALRDALRQVESLDDLQGIDPELMQRTLLTEEMEWIDKWSEMTGQLIDSGLVAVTGARLTLTSKAIHQIGSRLLKHLFLPPARRGRGHHQIPIPGTQGMPGEESSEWEWGRPLDLHIARSVINAVRRTPGSTSLQLTPDDFEVFDRESGASIHTVMLTDMSRSMFDSGAWDAAKRAAVALNTLISTRTNNDRLELVGFSGDARQLSIDELPALTWDQFSHGTNLHAALLVATRMLHRDHTRNRQVVIITDGEPTAFMDGADPIFEHPVTHRTTDATLLQARRMSRQGISFTVVCVGSSANAPEFAQMLHHTVGGRMILLPIEDLGAFVIRDVAGAGSRVIR